MSERIDQLLGLGRHLDFDLDFERANVATPIDNFCGTEKMDVAGIEAARIGGKPLTREYVPDQGTDSLDSPATVSGFAVGWNVPGREAVQ